jgi:hypothetical protein
MALSNKHDKKYFSVFLLKNVLCRSSFSKPTFYHKHQAHFILLSSS